MARLVTFYVRQATKRKHNELGLTTGPNYEGQLDVIELAGWRQRIPLPESSCFPGAGWRTTSLTQARLLLVLPCVVMTACSTVRVEDTRQTAAVIDAGEAAVCDLTALELAGTVSTDVSGTSFLRAIVIPIPLIARTRAKACKGLADQLKTFIVTDKSA